MKKLLAIAVLVLVGAFLVGCAPKEPIEPETEYLSEISLDMGEWFVKPAEVYAKAGDVTFTVTNTGDNRHEFIVEGMNIEDKVLINAGGSDTVTVNLAPGDYEAYCPIPGHKDAGMVATIHVV